MTINKVRFLLIPFILVIALIAVAGVISALSTNANSESYVYMPVISYDLQPPEPVNKMVYAGSITGQLFEIYSMNADGSNQQQLTEIWSVNQLYPAWSPDSSQIAFTSYGEFTSTLYVMDANGSDLRVLLNTPGYHEHPAWSPDGSKIAFTSDLHNPGVDANADIYVMNADGSGQPINITNSPNTYDYRPDWSPDGSKFAYATYVQGSPDREIFVMNVDGSNRVNLTNNPAADYAPEWSPSGQQIVFYRRLGSSGSYNREIFIMNRDGSGQTRVTHNAGQDWHPSWSPNGKQIAFQFNTGTTSAEDIYNSNLLVIDVDGSNRKNLTTTTDVAEVTVDWH